MLLAALPWPFFLSLLAIPSEAVRLPLPRHNIVSSQAAFSKMIIVVFKFYFEWPGDKQLFCLFREHIGLQHELPSLHGRRRWGNKVDIVIVTIIIVTIVIITIVIITIVIITTTTSSSPSHIPPPGLPVWPQTTTVAEWKPPKLPVEKSSGNDPAARRPPVRSRWATIQFLRHFLKILFIPEQCTEQNLC